MNISYKKKTFSFGQCFILLVSIVLVIGLVKVQGRLILPVVVVDHGAQDLTFLNEKSELGIFKLRERK